MKNKEYLFTIDKKYFNKNCNEFNCLFINRKSIVFFNQTDSVIVDGK